MGTFYSNWRHLNAVVQGTLVHYHHFSMLGIARVGPYQWHHHTTVAIQYTNTWNNHIQTYTCYRGVWSQLIHTWLILDWYICTVCSSINHYTQYMCTHDWFASTFYTVYMYMTCTNSHHLTERHFNLNRLVHLHSGMLFCMQLTKGQRWD